MKLGDMPPFVTHRKFEFSPIEFICHTGPDRTIPAISALNSALHCKFSAIYINHRVTMRMQPKEGRVSTNVCARSNLIQLFTSKSIFTGNRRAGPARSKPGDVIVPGEG